MSFRFIPSSVSSFSSHKRNLGTSLLTTQQFLQPFHPHSDSEPVVGRRHQDLMKQYIPYLNLSDSSEILSL